MIQMRRVRQLSGVWRLVALVVGDIAVVIATYELAWHIRTLSSFGIFEAPLPKNALTTVPHNYGMIVLSQIFLLWIVGLYKVNRITSGKTLLRIPLILFVQMMFLSLFCLLTLGRGGSPLSIFPVFWILNGIFTSLWRILAFFPSLHLPSLVRQAEQRIVFPAQELTRNRILKFKPFYMLMNFFRKDLARVFILGFMILLILCAVLLMFDPEKIVVIGKRTFFVKWIAEQVASVAYFLLVIGVGIAFVSMIRRKR